MPVHNKNMRHYQSNNNNTSYLESCLFSIQFRKPIVSPLQYYSVNYQIGLKKSIKAKKKKEWLLPTCTTSTHINKHAYQRILKVGLEPFPLEQSDVHSSLPCFDFSFAFHSANALSKSAMTPSRFAFSPMTR